MCSKVRLYYKTALVLQGRVVSPSPFDPSSSRARCTYYSGEPRHLNLQPTACAQDESCAYARLPDTPTSLTALLLPPVASRPALLACVTADPRIKPESGGGKPPQIRATPLCREVTNHKIFTSKEKGTCGRIEAGTSCFVFSNNILFFLLFWHQCKKYRVRYLFGHHRCLFGTLFICFFFNSALSSLSLFPRVPSTTTTTTTLLLLTYLSEPYTLYTIPGYPYRVYLDQ